MSEGDNGRVDLSKAWGHTLRAFGIIRDRYPGYLGLSGLHSLIQAVQPAGILYLSARIVNQLSGARNARMISVYVGVTVTLAFLLSSLRSAVERRLRVIESTFFQKMYFLHSEKYMVMDYGHVEKSGTNEMLADIEAKMQGNGLGIPDVYDTFPRLVLRLVGLVVSSLMLMGLFHVVGPYTENMATSPVSTIVLAALVLLTLAFTFRLRQKEQVVLRGHFERTPKWNTVGNYYSRYITEAAKDIRLYAQQPAIKAIRGEWENSSMWHLFFHRKGEFDAATAAANALSAGFVYLLIGQRALAGMYGIGSVLQYVGSVSLLVEHLAGLVNECASLVANSQYLEMAYEYLDLSDDRHKGTLTTEKRSDNEYEIEFRNVSLKYPNTETYALRNLSLRFTIGRRLAVVGMNGSGKTTMIKLLCRLYDPTEGEITLNGIDIRKYDYQEYVSLFSVVFQDFRLFSLPIGQNVAASTEVDVALAEECLKKAGFGERLRELPRGLDTCLYKDFDSDGVSISGGEAQKIALARALYKDAPFMVLDEPTAALDPIAEFEVYSRLNETIEDKTAVFISHRLSSCRFCDDIAVFHEGCLVQRGSHEELLAQKGGKYAELWNAQAQYYVTEKR